MIRVNDKVKIKETAPVWDAGAYGIVREITPKLIYVEVKTGIGASSDPMEWAECKERELLKVNFIPG